MLELELELVLTLSDKLSLFFFFSFVPRSSSSITGHLPGAGIKQNVTVAHFSRNQVEGKLRWD